MFEFILDICPAVFAGGMIFVGWMMEKDRRESRAEKLRRKRRMQRSLEIELAGARMLREDARASRRAELSPPAAAEDKPKTVVTVMASPKSCVVRKLPAGRREAMIRELIENGSKVQEK